MSISNASTVGTTCTHFEALTLREKNAISYMGGYVVKKLKKKFSKKTVLNKERNQ